MSPTHVTIEKLNVRNWKFADGTATKATSLWTGRVAELPPLAEIPRFIRRINTNYTQRCFLHPLRMDPIGNHLQQQFADKERGPKLELGDQVEHHQAFKAPRGAERYPLKTQCIH